jgi:hypothetical protein
MRKTRVEHSSGNHDQAVNAPNSDFSPMPSIDFAPPGARSFLQRQQSIGNQAALRHLNQQGSTAIQRQTVTTEQPAQTTTEPAAIPQADLGERSSGRAYALDWDSRHREIDGLLRNETLRQRFTLNLFTELSNRLPDVITASTSYAEAERQIRRRIAEANAERQPDEAQRIEREWNKSLQFAVVRTLNVENSDRYQPVPRGPTYCNIYTYDVVTALGGYLPRVWWNDDVIPRLRRGETVAVEYATTVHEMNANALTDWFANFGADFGWVRAADMTAAQTAANNGELTIIVAANENRRRSGHITVVMPETPAVNGAGGTTAARDQQNNVTIPTQSQAGRTNFEYGRGRSQWWQEGHEDGGAYIFRGARRSQLLSPEDTNQPNATPAR